jgi:hypothetical protein
MLSRAIEEPPEIVFASAGRSRIPRLDDLPGVLVFLLFRFTAAPGFRLTGSSTLAIHPPLVEAHREIFGYGQ